MIQEVIYGLAGYAGGLVRETETGFVIGSEDRLTLSERQLLERALEAGFLCKKLSDFAASTRSRHFTGLAATSAEIDEKGSTASKPGHYMYGLVLSIERALDDYRGKVLDLEAQVKLEPSLPLAYIAQSVDGDCRVLRMLHRIVTQVAARPFRGGALLDVIWKAASHHMGSGDLHRCLWSAVCSVGNVLANQLVAWMVYGRLSDPDGEFFVRRVGGRQTYQPGAALYGEVEDLSQPMTAVAAQREWQSLFELRPESIPKNIVTMETAKKVLFAGKAVRVLLRGNRWLRRTDDSWESSLQGNLDPTTLQNEVDFLRGCFMSKSPAIVVEQSVDRIRHGVAIQLRNFIVDEAEICQHLAAMKGFFLLGYGAFYQTFLDSARKLLQGRPPWNAERELQAGPWAAAMSEHEGPDAQGPGSVPPTPAASSRRLPLERRAASKFQLSFVPRRVELPNFTDAGRRVRLVGQAHMEGGSATLGSEGAGGTPALPPAMMWLATKVCLSTSFQHSFSFQLTSPPPPGASPLVATALPEYGGRFALCFQPRWTPAELEKSRHAEAELDGQTLPGHPSLWTSLGECLALEVEYRVLPHRASSSPVSEVSLSLYLRPPAECRGRHARLQRLGSTTLRIAEVRQMIHLVRLWHNPNEKRLQVFFGADAVAPALELDFDMSASLALEMGHAFAGLALLPLDFQHDVESRDKKSVQYETSYSSRDRPVLFASWNHSQTSPSSELTSRMLEELAAASSQWFVNLHLTYEAVWPLPLVFTQRCLERYNHFFRILLAFRHAHLELQRCELPRGNVLAWALKSQLSFFVSQVLQFFQQDVIEASFRTLLRTIRESTVFDEVVAAHEEFLSALTVHFFLQAPDLHHELMSALRIVTLFSQTALLQTYRSPQATTGLKDIDLRRLQADFMATVRSVIRMMATLNREGVGMHAHLVQLLLRLDYNNYFSGTEAV
ncbi:GCP4 [Symbiodinium sp. CCMP2592]|nr:GCP4 [Symbiodinium sp. CCMP2592]